MIPNINLSPLLTQPIRLKFEREPSNTPLLEIFLQFLPPEELVKCTLVNKHVYGVIRESHLLQVELITHRIRRDISKYEHGYDRALGYLYLAGYDSYEENLRIAKEEAKQLNHEWEVADIWTQIVREEAPYNLLSAFRSLMELKDTTNLGEGYYAILSEIIRSDSDFYEQSCFIISRLKEQNLISQAWKKVMKRWIADNQDFSYQSWFYAYPPVLDFVHWISIFTYAGDTMDQIEYLNYAELCLQIVHGSSHQWKKWISAMAKFDWDRAYSRLSSIGESYDKYQAIQSLLLQNPTNYHFDHLQQLAHTLSPEDQARFWIFTGSLAPSEYQNGFFAIARDLIDSINKPEVKALVGIYLFHFSSLQEDLDLAKRSAFEVQDFVRKSNLLITISLRDPSFYEEARSVLTELDESLESLSALLGHLEFHNTMLNKQYTLPFNNNCQGAGDT